MTFFDQGLSFDFSKVDKPDVTASLSERKIGGLGIYLMHKLMDVVEYKVADDRKLPDPHQTEEVACLARGVRKRLPTGGRLPVSASTWLTPTR